MLKWRSKRKKWVMYYLILFVWILICNHLNKYSGANHTVRIHFTKIFICSHIYGNGEGSGSSCGGQLHSTWHAFETNNSTSFFHSLTTENCKNTLISRETINSHGCACLFFVSSRGALCQIWVLNRFTSFISNWYGFGAITNLRISSIDSSDQSKSSEFHFKLLFLFN